jgi:hypothetical protein
MTPTRPIKTFAKWFEHGVTVYANRKNWDRVRLHVTGRGLQCGNGARGLELDNFDFYETVTMSGDSAITFHFDSIYDANDLIKAIKRKHRVHYSKGDSGRTNQELFGNFTMADLKGIFGDPLPRKVQYLLDDLKRRNIDYFRDFAFMHQAWSKQKWWPEAMVYTNELRYSRMNPPVDIGREQLIWLNQMGLLNLTRRHACGMIEFASANDAMLFKLTFGEDPVPK